MKITQLVALSDVKVETLLAKLLDHTVFGILTVVSAL
jgi:hypothetical protein